MTGREVARAETERGELVLRERDEDGLGVLELRVNGVFVMDTLETSTERALATAALSRAADPRRVLVGGLGLGFTLHEVLADPRVEEVVVVEVEEPLVRWMRDGTVPHGPAFLADARARVVLADVVQAVREGRDASYDLVLLDVDNGPAYLVHEDNARVYAPPFLGEARRLLRPGGELVVWAANRSPALLEDLRDVFDDVEEAGLPVDLQGRPETYWLYRARIVSRHG